MAHVAAQTDLAARIELSIAAVPVSSARAWLRNAGHILDQLSANATTLPFRLPLEMGERMREALAAMAPPASRTDEEHMTTVLSFEPGVLRDLVTYWFNITKLTGDQRASLQIDFGIEAGAAFADALATAVGEAMAAHPSLAEFAARLAREWDDCQPGFTAAFDADPV